MIFVLVITLLAGTDGGRAISTNLYFNTKAGCAEAKNAIDAAHAKAF